MNNVYYLHPNGSKPILLQYRYDAFGEKLYQAYVDTLTTTKWTRYQGIFQYEDASPDFFFTAEGRCVDNQDGTYKYEYYLRDHLGNIRSTFDYECNTTRLVEVSHYYPFGLVMDSVSLSCLSPGVRENQYTYNGKEWQDEGGFNQYDYGARMYDPAVGRWWVIDRFSEKYTSLSPYAYAANDPVLLVDIHGDSLWINYTDADGIDQRMLYTPGMEYNGDNDFVSATVSYYNGLASNENTAEVVNHLSDSELNYTAINESPPVGNYALLPTNEGGTFYLGGLGEASRGGTDFIEIGLVAHELFHGYQRDVIGLRPNTIQNELEAQLFGGLAELAFDQAMGQSSTVGTPDGQVYADSYFSLLFDGYDSGKFDKSLNAFKNGTAINARNRVYDRLPLKDTPPTPILISKFLPYKD